MGVAILLHIQMKTNGNRMRSTESEVQRWERHKERNGFIGAVNASQRKLDSPPCAFIKTKFVFFLFNFHFDLMEKVYLNRIAVWLVWPTICLGFFFWITFFPKRFPYFLPTQYLLHCSIRVAQKREKKRNKLLIKFKIRNNYIWNKFWKIPLQCFNEFLMKNSSQTNEVDQWVCHLA